MAFYASASGELGESFVCPTIAPLNASFDASELQQNAKDLDSRDNNNSSDNNNSRDNKNSRDNAASKAPNWNGCKVKFFFPNFFAPKSRESLSIYNKGNS